MPTRNINLTDRFDRFVEEQVQSGTYSNASEVMRAGLRLLELQSHEEQRKLAVLRSLAKEGFDQLDQGAGIVLNGAEQLAAHIRRTGKRAAASVQRRRRK